MIDLIWDAVKDTLYITREQFEQSLEGYTLTEMTNTNGTYAVVLSKGPSFHFMTLGPKWSLSKEILRQWPGSLIAQYGYAETFTPLDDTRQQRFNRRLGFVETSRNDDYIFYRIEGLKQ